MTYKLLKQGVRRLQDGACIPDNSANTDWLRYQKWLAEGNTPEPQDPDPLPPTFEQEVQSHFDSNKFMRGLVRVLANRFNLTPQQILAAIKNAID
jgi:hypothetical protein